MKIDRDIAIHEIRKDYAHKDVGHDPFDIDFQINPSGGEMNDNWTSKSVCTPGCTNGTGNSYCCTCK